MSESNAILRRLLPVSLRLKVLSLLVAGLRDWMSTYDIDDYMHWYDSLTSQCSDAEIAAATAQLQDTHMRWHDMLERCDQAHNQSHTTPLHVADHIGSLQLYDVQRRCDVSLLQLAQRSMQPTLLVVIRHGS